MYTSLLQRQLKKYFKETPLTPELQQLLEAINRSYEHYERDHILGKKSLEVSTEEQRELTAELVNKESYTRAILEAASDGILVINEEKKIEVCNPRAAHYLGYKSSEELVGQNISLFSLPNEKGLYEYVIHRPDESNLEAEISVSEFILNQKKLSIYVVRDITLRKHSEKMAQAAQQRELALQKELVTIARQAGMMQVATSVLHNVGNVLNTVNTSLTLLHELSVYSDLHKLPRIAEMLIQHKDDLASYLTQDAKGKILPEFLIALSERWKKEIAIASQELELLSKSVQLIKNIIKTQQSMGGLMGIKELTDINSLIDDLLLMHSKDFKTRQVVLEKEYGTLPQCNLDRGRLLQILVNLILNALDAVACRPEDQRLIGIKTALENNQIIIEVRDNGVGIDNKDMIKIFSHGFTTKESGHGFGLHTSAYLAKEIGGQLLAKSDGIGKGAVFSIILPFQEETS